MLITLVSPDFFFCSPSPSFIATGRSTLRFRVRTELMYIIPYCLANPGASICRSPSEIIAYKFVLTSHGVCLIHLFVVCEMGDEWPYSSVLWGFASWICSKQHVAFLYCTDFAFSPCVLFMSRWCIHTVVLYIYIYIYKIIEFERTKRIAEYTDYISAER